MAELDDGVSEEFKKKVEELFDRLGPKNKENNSLWQLVSEIEAWQRWNILVAVISEVGKTKPAW